MVWAKVFLYTWWPGRIVRMKNGSRALVSFFCCNITLWFRTFQIREFEASYARMLKMVGVKLSEAITFALEEMSLREVSALACPCRASVSETNDASVDRNAKAKQGLDPRGMLDFVLDMSVSPSIDDSETVSVIRASAKAIAFRRHVSLCPDDGLKRGWLDEEETSGVTDTGAEFYARQETMQHLGDSSSDATEGSGRPVSDTSSENEMVHGGSGQPGCDFLVEMHEEDGKVSLEQVQGCSDICMINREDFSILDFDEEYDSLLHNQLVTVIDTCMEDYAEKQNLSTGSPSQESDVDATSNESFGHETDDNQSVETETFFNVSKGTVNSLTTPVPNPMQTNVADLTSVHIIQSGKDVAFSNTLVTCSETEMAKQHGKIITATGREIHDSVAYTFSSSPESDADAACNGNFCRETGNNHNADNHTVFHISEGSLDSLPTYNANHEQASIGDVLGRDHVINSCDAASLGNILLMTSETEIAGQQDNVTSIGHEISDSASVLVCPSGSFLPNIAPCEELLVHPESMCSKQSSDQKFKSSTFQSNSRASLDGNSENADKENTTNIISGFLVPSKSASERSLQKGWDDEAVPCKKLQKMMMPYSEAVADASHMKEEHSSNTDGNTAVCPETKRNLFLDKARKDVVKSHSTHNTCIISHESNEKADNFKANRSIDVPKHVSRSSLCKSHETIPSAPSDWQRLYASPLTRDSSSSIYKVTDGSDWSHKSLHMKFPKGFNLPSKEELEKKFEVFGPLDSLRTKVFFYTGSGRVVFLHESDVLAAYRSVKEKNVFGQVKVNFWLDKYEKHRRECETPDLSKPLKEHLSLEHSSSGLKKCNQGLSPHTTGHSSLDIESCCQESSIPTVPTVGHSASNLKSCLKRPNIPMEWDMKKRCKVRFLMET